jgi:glycerate kinase
MVEILEAGLAHLAEVVRAQLGLDVRDLAGAGAAGGLAAGAVAFMNGRLVSGVDEVMAQSRLPEKLAGADWVITGEGRFDGQSLRGKVVSGVTRAARQKGAKVAVIAGQVCLAPADYHAAGVEIALACMPDGLSLDEAMSRSESLLIQAARRWAHTLI